MLSEYITEALELDCMGDVWNIWLVYHGIRPAAILDDSHECVQDLCYDLGIYVHRAEYGNFATRRDLEDWPRTASCKDIGELLGYYHPLDINELILGSSFAIRFTEVTQNTELWCEVIADTDVAEIKGWMTWRKRGIERTLQLVNPIYRVRAEIRTFINNTCLTVFSCD